MVKVKDDLPGMGDPASMSMATYQNYGHLNNNNNNNNNNHSSNGNHHHMNSGQTNSNSNNNSHGSINNNNYSVGPPRKQRSYHHGGGGSHHFHHSHHHHHCTFPQPIQTTHVTAAPADAGDPSANGGQPARFYFGPGFEPQAPQFGVPTVGGSGGGCGNVGCTAGPSQPPNNSEYVVLFHVNPGVTIKFQMGDNLEVLRGPVTVPMVSTNSSPPIAMPVQVPPGHIVQQIVDESGTLRHVILSPQHSLLPITSHNPPHYGAGPPNGTNHPPQPFHYGIPQTYASHHPHFHSNIPPGMHPVPPHPPGHSPPPSYCKDERSQRQYIKLKKKHLDKQQKNVDSLNGRKELVNGIKRVKDKGMNSVGTSEDGEESSSLQDEDDSAHIITDILSSVQAPKVSELTSRSALLQWAAPLRLSEASSNDSHELDIPENELRYEVLLSDKSKEMKYKSIYSGASLSCRIQDLRPGLEYSVCLQVHLEELQGSASDPLKFTTPPCEPDPPQPPKLIQRTKNSLQLRWNATNSNGSSIQQYILEYDEGKGGAFVELHKTKGNQHSLQKLTPATRYAFRLSAVNEIGRSQYSDVIIYKTSEMAPPQPAPPKLEKFDIRMLHLSWERRATDDEFSLEMNNPHNEYGYQPVFNGPETEYVCVNLQRYTNYKFKLRAKNEGGRSDWSEEVTFQTLPDRPQKPSKPVVKGKIHARSFRLKWEPPSDTGGAEISKYILEVNSGSDYSPMYAGVETEALCDKMTPGTTYQLRVYCESIGGLSPPSEPCTVTTDAVCPGQCPAVRLLGKAKATSLALCILEPDYNGGAPILEYEVEMTSPDNSRSLVYKSKEVEAVVGNLQPGCTYIFHVRALNRVGAGEWSEPAEICSGAAPPDACTAPIATCKSPTHILVEWQPPATNGAAITEYRLEMSSDMTEHFAPVYQGEVTSFDVKHLTPFTTYYFCVAAANSAGYGTCSPPCATITPAAPPSQIQHVRHTSTPTSITLVWQEPASNGMPISHYVIELADQVITTDGPVHEHIVDGLQPETTYKLKMRAVNSVGAGANTSSVRIATTKLPPAPPRIECIGVGHNYLKLKWGEGKNAEYTQYTIVMENSRLHDYQVVFKGTAFTCKVNKLVESTHYRFRICASNDAGEGDYSCDYEFATNIAPPTAVKPPKVVEVDQKSCALEWLPSKNATSDPIEYCVQLSRLKDQQYKEVYKGADTKCTLDRLDAGVEYSVRVCPIRKTTSGDLPGPVSAFTKFSTTAIETTISQRAVTHTTTPTHRNKSKGLMRSLRAWHTWLKETDDFIILTLLVFIIALVLGTLIGVSMFNNLSMLTNMAG